MTQIASLGRDHNSKSELLFLLNAYWFVVVVVVVVVVVFCTAQLSGS